MKVEIALVAQDKIMCLCNRGRNLTGKVFDF